MNNQQQRQTYSWTIVIIALIVFWPIGIFLLIGKLTNDRSASFGAGSFIIKFVGGVLLFFGFMGIWYGIDTGEMTGAIGMIVIFGLPGFWLWKKGRKTKANGIKYKAYINYVVNNEVREVVELSNLMHLSQEQVVNDINDMISKGMLGRARLNLNTGVIQFPKPKPRPSTPHRDSVRQPSYRPSTPHRDSVRQPQRQAQERRPEPVYKPFEPKTIRCTSCSANNFVEQLPAQCDYCGSSLHE